METIPVLEPKPPPPPAGDVPPQPPRRGRPVIAWLLIAAVIGLLFGARAYNGGDAPRDDKLGSLVLELQSRYIVGVSDLVPAARQQLIDEIDTAPGAKGGPAVKLRTAVLVGELMGPEKALERLARMPPDDAAAPPDDAAAPPDDAAAPPDDAAARTRGLLTRLYTDYVAGRWDAPSLSAADREYLTERLGWLGRLALAPAGNPAAAAERAELLAAARRTAMALVLFLSVGLPAALAGLVLLILFLVLLGSGQLRTRLTWTPGNGGVYAETFAVWMLLFILLSTAAAVLAPRQLLLGDGTAMIGAALLALGWPVLRGIPWREVRSDIGLTAGDNPAAEPLLGVVGYMGSLPLLGLGLVIMLLLLAIWQQFHPPDGEAGTPGHPIAGEVLGGNWWVRIQLLLVAGVLAPVTEEIMFRGVLYRHLREAASGLGFAGGVLAAGLPTSFVFAVIHPQGLFAVPVLMGLAMGFTLLREWRGTLVPAVVAHGVNNTAVFLLLIGATG
jgi:membrane protease YdiL (CAAX protease family)